MQYRRVFIPGGTYFFTLVTEHRQPFLQREASISLLRKSFAIVLKSHPFDITAIVILPDHLHMVITLPSDDKDFPTRLRLLKSTFTRMLDDKPPNESTSRTNKGEQEIWQRRFWEHQIRDEQDLTNHIEYIHFNPVKHGLSQFAFDWPYSSFRHYVKSGLYPTEWGVSENFSFPLHWQME